MFSSRPAAGRSGSSSEKLSLVKAGEAQARVISVLPQPADLEIGDLEDAFTSGTVVWA